MMNAYDTDYPLQADAISVDYDEQRVLQSLSIDIPAGETTVIIGPNGCGKSTLLKSLARLLSPQQGTVWLEGTAIAHQRTRDIARRLGILPQSSHAPADIRVRELVARGRYPHRGLLARWRDQDELAINNAMMATAVAALADRRVDTLSGGQRQRVWLAMVLAQQTPTLLLDEPTTWLDVAHQIELLELMNHLREEHGKTLVMVLHDLNQACRYATHLVAMKEGHIVAQGRPADIVTPEIIETVFGLKCVVIDDPIAHTPMIVPLGGYSHHDDGLG